MRSLEAELNLHAMFLSPGQTLTAGAVISIFRRDFLSKFWWVVPEEVTRGRVLRVWLIGPEGIAIFTNVHMDPVLPNKKKLKTFAHLGKNSKIPPRYDVIAGDFNLPPSDEFPSDEKELLPSLETMRKRTGQ